MARVILYLREQELSALQVLAQREYRAPKAQAALIIRKELERLGMITPQKAEEAEPELPADDSLKAAI